MCHDENDKSMIVATGSSNKAHGICCRPDYYGEFCNAEKTYLCSEPTDAKNTPRNYKAILSPDNMNHQMFAFCP
jgi:hypothetical protein